jgi:DNA-directed RNA polymerase subunit M/transcription elongation factor TFIIS
MVCPLDQGLLFSNQDDEEEIFLYCLSCQYKSYIGSAVYSKMLEGLKNATKK